MEIVYVPWKSRCKYQWSTITSLRTLRETQMAAFRANSLSPIISTCCLVTANTEKRKTSNVGPPTVVERILHKLLDRIPFLSNKGSALFSRWTLTHYKKAHSASFSIVLACCLHWLTLSQAKGSQRTALATYTFLRH